MTLTLRDYTIILPIDSPKQGYVMHIASIDPTNHIIYFEWSEKFSTETEFSDARVTNRLYFGSSSTDEYIQGDNFNLTIISGGELDITATLVDITGPLTASGTITGGSLTDSSLTSGRVVFAGTGGVLSDDGDLTFAADTLTVTKIGPFEAAGAINFATQAMTSVNIDSGAIDAVTIGTNSPCTQLVVDNVNIDGATIGHTDDTDLITLADGSVTFTGSTVIATADINGGTIDAVTIGTNSPCTQLVVDNVNIDGATIGHTDDTDLITLADGSVTFTGSTVIATADINGGTIDAVTIGTNSPCTQLVVDNVNIDGATIGHTSDTDLITLADGSVTFTGSTVIATADIDGGTIDGTTIATSDITVGVTKTLDVSGTFTFSGSTVAASTCFEINTLVNMKDGSTKKYGELSINDEIKALTIDGMINSDDPYVYLNIELTSLNVTDTTTKVFNKKYDSVNYYFLINGTLKITGEHVLFIKRDTIWKYRRVWQIQQNDKMYDINKNEVNINSITEITNDWIDVCTIDVESTDNYFAGDILSHNAGTGKMYLIQNPP